jgi:hypothetical protein
MSKPISDEYDPITPGDDECDAMGKHECMPSYQDGRWEARPGALTLWHLGVVLTSDEEKRNPPPELRDAYHAVRDHPAVAGIMHYALELFPNHVRFATATMGRLKLWLQVEQGFRPPDVGQVTLVEVERLLREEIEAARAATAAKAAAAPPTLSRDQPSDPEQNLEWIALAVGDPTTIEVIKIASNKSRPGEERMIAILRLDSRYEGWESPQWGRLLDVNPAAVRQYDTWKKLQAMRKTGD